MEIKINKSKSPSKSNIINKYKNSFFLYEYIDIILGDPISSVLLSDKYAIIGTMMGRIKLLSLTENGKIILICSGSQEYISGLSLSDDNTKLYASIGDLEILSQEIREPLTNILPPSNYTKIYENDYEHNFCCDNSYVLMATYNLLKINIFLPENEEAIKEDTYIKYEVIYFNKNDKTNNNYKGEIKSTNFFVPLDFDGNYFCWVEYINDQKDRNLCIQYVDKDEIITKVDYQFHIDKNYGHINHAKIINKNRIFIVHDLNKCEIRNIYNNNFELIESFTHIGDEVYAVDIYMNDTNTFYSEKNNYNNINLEKNIYQSYSFNNDHIYKGFNNEKFNESQKLNRKKLPKIDINRNKKSLIPNSIELKTDSLNLLKNKSKKIKCTDNNTNFSIITLDIDGNVNKYENGVEEKLFNLYDINDIELDHKDKKFFNMGYVYYIKSDLNYFCISTDHGCYVIKRNE